MEIFGIKAEYVILGVAFLMIVFIILLIKAMINQKKMMKRYEKFMKGSDGKSLESSMRLRMKQIDELLIKEQTHEKDIENIYSELAYTFQKIGMVKYDAFNEMGGKLSFVLTLLDKGNNGFILNSMQGREGSYMYIKEVIDGKALLDLGEEEKVSLEKALYNE